MMEKFKERMRNLRVTLKDDSGLSVVEMILILVVIIALVVIFRDQLKALVNTIFERIASESSGI